MSMDEKCRWDGVFPDIKGGVDLNCCSMIGLIFGVDNPEGDHEHRQDTVRTVDGFPALDDVLPRRRALWRRSRCSGGKCTEQFRAMAVAQLTWRESLRDIEVCLSAQSSNLY